MDLNDPRATARRDFPLTMARVDRLREGKDLRPPSTAEVAEVATARMGRPSASVAPAPVRPAKRNVKRTTRLPKPPRKGTPSAHIIFVKPDRGDPFSVGPYPSYERAMLAWKTQNVLYGEAYVVPLVPPKYLFP